MQTAVLLLAVPMIWASVLAAFSSMIRRAWSEPVFRYPIVVLESDDWGPGPPNHECALRRLTGILLSHVDIAGRPATMTLGTILTVPDADAVRGNGIRSYAALSLDHPRFAGIVAAMRAGCKQGVFHLQLHGLSHYRPKSVLTAAQREPVVAGWLTSEASLESEGLLSVLQSRWTDAAVLPSRRLEDQEISAAVSDELLNWNRMFGAAPQIAVPPTFVWDERVEKDWAAGGVRCVITPGRRFVGYDKDGRLVPEGNAYYNGETGPGGMIYLVRDVYFEPIRGHRVEQVVQKLVEKTATGRPCLIETHRANYVRRDSDKAYSELDRLISAFLLRFPNIRFASNHMLLRQLQSGGNWLEHRLVPRIKVWARRMMTDTRFRRVARLTGLAIPFAVLQRLEYPSTIREPL